VKLLEKWVNKAGAEALTLEEIQEDLSLEYEHFQRARQSIRDKEESGGETALYAGGQFKGKCQGYGKHGHKVANYLDKNEKDGSRKTNGNKMGEFKGKCFKCHEFGHKASNCPNKGKNNEGGGHQDTAEVALAIMDVGKISQIFGNNKLESNRTGRDFGEERAKFGKISAFGNNSIPDDFFDNWSLFKSQDDDDTSQEVMANNGHPEKEGEYCMMCHESSMSQDHAWCLEGKGTVKVSKDEAHEDEDMGDDKEPVETCCKTPKEKERLEEIIIGCECLKYVKSYPKADWAMVSDDDVDTKVALMATETKRKDPMRDLQQQAGKEEEEEELVDLNESLWASALNVTARVHWDSFIQDAKKWFSFMMDHAVLLVVAKEMRKMRRVVIHSNGNLKKVVRRTN
jgi:hypothetical protein